MSIPGIDSVSKGGKAKGRHFERRLKASMIKKAAPGRHTDGGGLYLVVDPSGASRWLLRITVQGRRRDLGLGSKSVVSLDEARNKSDELRRVARNGGDPVAENEASTKLFITFDELAERVHREWIVPRSSNGKHVQQWISTLNTYASPVIGKKPVHLISRSDIFEILNPIWKAKHETARRVRQRMGVVFDYALEAEIRKDGNPVQDVMKGRKGDAPKVEHFRAASWDQAANIFWFFSTEGRGRRTCSLFHNCDRVPFRRGSKGPLGRSRRMQVRLGHSRRAHEGQRAFRGATKSSSQEAAHKG